MTDQESIEILESLIPPLSTKDSKTSLSNVHHCTFDESSIAKTKSNGNATDDEGEHVAAAASSGGCPFFAPKPTTTSKCPTKKFFEWQTSISIASEPIVYHDYLNLDKILNAQFPVSKKYGTMAHDEHLFIIIHQGMNMNIFIKKNSD